MEIRRFFISPKDKKGDIITLRGDEFWHLKTVLRLKVGFVVEILDNNGNVYLSKIEKIEKDCAILSVESEKFCAKENFDIHLFSGILKNNKLDFVIQKCVELGANRITPFLSDNTSETKFNQDRAEKIAYEASKQCKSTYLAEIDDLVSIAHIADTLSDYDVVVLANEYENKTKMADIDIQNLCNMCQSRAKIAIIVGSEGGFSISEIEKLTKCNNVHSISLGKRILRAETANIVTLTLLLNALGAM